MGLQHIPSGPQRFVVQTRIAKVATEDTTATIDKGNSADRGRRRVGICCVLFIVASD